MITFNITFTADPNAVGGFIDYQTIIPPINGPASLSSWTTLTTIGNVLGYFPITPPTVTFNNLQGNPPGFQPNTTYIFRVRLLCAIDGVFQESISTIDDPKYVLECTPFTLSLGIIQQQSGAYPIQATVSTAIPNSSIYAYTFSLYDPNDLVNPLAQITEQADILESSLPYTAVFDDNIVPGGIVQGVNYYVSVTPSVQTSLVAATSPGCDPKQIQIPLCYTWKVRTGDSWRVEWLDCNGQTYNCGGLLPYEVQTGQPELYICSPQQPVTYWCNNGTLSPSIIDPGTGLPSKGALVVSTLPNITPCDFNLFDYDTTQNPPVLNGYPCQTC